MSCADVCLSMDYDGSNEFYADKHVRAKKPHRCCECGRDIAVGETYHRATGKSHGVLFTEATCAPCAEIRQVFSCGAWVFSMLWETMRDEMFPVWSRVGPYDCLAKLKTPEAIEKCVAEFNEYLADHDEPPFSLTPEAPHA